MMTPRDSLKGQLTITVATLADYFAGRAALKLEGGDIAFVFGIDARRAVEEFMQGGRIDSTRAAFQRAVVRGYGDAAREGWLAGGGLLEDLPGAGSGAPQEIIDLAAKLFDDLRLLRARQLAGENVAAMIQRRLDFWVRGVAAHFGEWKMRAIGKKRGTQGSLMGTWKYQEGKDHCTPKDGRYSCQALNGQRHTMEWFLSRGLVPAKPAAAMPCRGYECGCGIFDDNGGRLI